MARIDKVPVEFSYGLADLTGDDLRVLDLSLSYFTDWVRKHPDALPNPGDDKVLSDLHQLVLNIKRGD